MCKQSPRGQLLVVLTHDEALIACTESRAAAFLCVAGHKRVFLCVLKSVCLNHLVHKNMQAQKRVLYPMTHIGSFNVPLPRIELLTLTMLRSWHGKHKC